MISVIVPVYNVEPYLHRCVDSILAQTFTDFDLILVDDGSPDNCPAICDEYAERDSRVHVIHQENGGLSAARNAGIDWAFANSDSQWLTFVDSDDWIHPEMLKSLYHAAQDLHVPVSVCGYAETSDDGPEISSNICRAELCTAEEFYVQKLANATIACGKLYQKDCFSKFRYPVGKIHEDEFTTYKILFTANRIAVIPFPLYFYFQNPAGIMNSAWSPKRLVSLAARDEQIAFFTQNGFNHARLRAAKALLWDTTIQIDAVSQVKPLDKKCLYQLQRSMRKNLALYKKDLQLSVRRDSYLFERAYPTAMRLYWLIRTLAKKLGMIAV